MRIIKRKKGNEEFYYLQHSFRENDRVKTKELYLGKELPPKEEIERLKKELGKEQKDELNLKLEAIKANFQKEWKRLPQKMKEKEFEEIAIAFTYNTNAIEGSTITLEETRGILEEKMAPNKPIKDIKETEGHARVFFEMLKEKKKVDEEIVLKWHKEIFQETQQESAGKFRDYLVRVGEYLAPDWQDVKKLMRGFIEFIYENKKMNAVELTARVHYKFERIHPFGDGNGRIGRMLMNHILWHGGYPMVIIAYKKRKSYYKAFKKDEDNFVRYFTRYYLSVHKNRYK